MELMWLKKQRAFTALYASKGDSWQGRDAYLAGTKRDPQIMTAAMQADRSSRRASIVLVAPVTCLSSPEPEDPDLLRCWRVNRGADSDLMGLLIVGSCQKGPCNFLAHSRVRVTQLGCPPAKSTYKLQMIVMAAYTQPWSPCKGS